MICFNTNLKVISGSSFRVIDPVYVIANCCVGVVPVKEMSVKKYAFKISLRLIVQRLSQSLSSEVPSMGSQLNYLRRKARERVLVNRL